MEEVWAKKGVQIWNEDRTEGYEFVEDVYPHKPLQSKSIKPLGEAEEPKPNMPVPEWFGKIALQRGELKKYLERNPQDDVSPKPVIKENSHVQDQNDQG